MESIAYDPVADIIRNAHGHILPDAFADPGTYPYPDGCLVIVISVGHAEFIPNPFADANGEP